MTLKTIDRVHPMCYICVFVLIVYFILLDSSNSLLQTNLTLDKETF